MINQFAEVTWIGNSSTSTLSRQNTAFRWHHRAWATGAVFVAHFVEKSEFNVEGF